MTPGIGVPVHEQSASTTQSAIAAGNVTVRSDAETGHNSLAGISRDTKNANATQARIFDAEKVAEQQEFTRVLSEVGFRAVGDIARSRTRAYEEAEHQKKVAQAALSDADPEKRAALEQMIVDADATIAAQQDQYDHWKDGGIYKIALHALVGAASGDVAGGSALTAGLAAGVNEAKSPLISEITQELDKNQRKLVHELASLATGAAIGGEQGAAIALNADLFNRQLHPREIDWIKGNARAFAQEQNGGREPTAAEIEQATARLTQQALKEVDFLWLSALADGDDDAAKRYLSSAHGQFANSLGESQQLFTTQHAQFFAPQQGLHDTDAEFIGRYARPGVSGSIDDGVWRETRQLGARVGDAVAADPLGVGMTVIAGLAEGAWQAVTHPVDTAGEVKDNFVARSQDVGEGLAASFDETSRNQLNALYGQDVSDAVAVAAGLNVVTLVGEAAGAGKVAGKAADLTGEAAKKAAEKIATSVDNTLDAHGKKLLIDSGGVFTSDGVPLMDFRNLTNAQKTRVGELLGGNLTDTLVPDGQHIGRAPGPGETGIDDLVKVNRPDVDYVIVEYKFGSSKLGDTDDGKQMSDDWLRGDKTDYNRVLKSVGGDRAEALRIDAALSAGRVEKWVVHTDPFGKVSVGILDSKGKFVVQPTSNVLSGGR